MVCRGARPNSSFQIADFQEVGLFCFMGLWIRLPRIEKISFGFSLLRRSMSVMVVDVPLRMSGCRGWYGMILRMELNLSGGEL